MLINARDPRGRSDLFEFRGFRDAICQHNRLEYKISNEGKFSILRKGLFEKCFIHQLFSLRYQLPVNLPLNDCFLKLINLFVYFPGLCKVLFDIIPLGFRYGVFLFIQVN